MATLFPSWFLKIFDDDISVRLGYFLLGTNIRDCTEEKFVKLPIGENLAPDEAYNPWFFPIGEHMNVRDLQVFNQI
jgi:hypothetical protein